MPTQMKEYTLGSLYKEFGYNEQISLLQNHWLQCLKVLF